jgi:pimeloyl-ACP methyl ester carboxylesterase
MSWETVRQNFYGDCGEEVARGAFARLRSQALTVFTERCPLDEWPSVPSTYILMTGDRSVGNAWSRSAAQRIGADLIELPGSHSPFYSRPAELAEVLVKL